MQVSRSKVLVVGALTAAAGAAAILLYSRRGMRSRVPRPLTVQLSSLLGQRKRVIPRAAQAGAAQGGISLLPTEYPQVWLA